jgi:tRNA threonylcarbamoyladenosine modification (KEOPS) complex Cgi121 subunit
MLTHHHAHIAAAHVLHFGAELAAFAVEQGQRVARLHAQHLHMASSGGRQV